MNQEEKKDSQSFYDEHDPFTSFMFGGKQSIREGQMENQQEFLGANEWLFGSQNRDHNKKNVAEERSESTQLNHLLTNVNMEELLKNMDTIINSASQFKPLLKKVTPLIDKWIK
ncbi:hypothetical protein JMM81_04915 [Bacillus sp. V3B]|uniref:hypothetical protein n=1 Tax=Bacillus sp. V3B TaxID=2804915 RepID=UPI002108F8D8|nr:hypothetical protein [Bacillus sp. V3B]MCQ6274318.1 hypothetical protein [Bacillus sp. V3B]